MKKKVKYIFASILIFFIFIVGVKYFSNKYTYIEYQYITAQSNNYIEIPNTSVILQQEIVAPYDLLYGISIQAKTFQNDNNSNWEISLLKDNNIVYKWQVNGSEFTDNNYYFMKAPRTILTSKGEKYILQIQAKNCDDNTKLGFATSNDSDSYSAGKLLLEGKEYNGDLCSKIYGGQRELGWILVYVIIILYLSVVFYSLLKGKKQGINVQDNNFFWALLVGGIYVIITTISSNSIINTFTDENDNIRGGLLIAKGNVLYRDYNTQHTPFTYYLCGLFAKLGAQSIEQFRVWFNILSGFIWIGVYARYSKPFGRIRIALVPFVILAVNWILFWIRSTQILSDNIQNICMVILLLEFLLYLRDKQLGLKRSAIVSGCLFISFTAAFISVYSLIFIIFGVIWEEFLLWKEKKKFNIRSAFYRYWRLLFCCIMPFALMIFYFAINNTLSRAYQMAFKFNTEVYANYLGGFGNNVIKPFFLVIKYLGSIIINSFNSIFTLSADNSIFLQLFLVLFSIIFLVWEGFRNRKIFHIITIFMFWVCNATRGMSDFHSVPFWSVGVLIVILYFPKIYYRFKKSIYNRITGILAMSIGLYMVFPFFNGLIDCMFLEPNIISDLEYEIVSLTQSGESIFIDTFVCDSIYLLYKERYPVNRTTYLLPWYMDWCENETVEDLLTNKPGLVIYDPEIIVWNRQHFFNTLDNVIKENYSQLRKETLIWTLNK